MDVGVMNYLNATPSATLDTILSAQQVSGGGVQEEVEVLLMPPWGYTVTAIILFFIGFFGFIFNLIVIVLMYKDIQLWTPINIILLNLVCSDLSVSILGNPLTFTAAIHRSWIFGRPLCIFYGYFMSLLGITSITTLTVLSYERFCLVCRPLSHPQSRNRNSYVIVLIIWAYSFLLTTPPIFGWGQYVVEVPNVSCSVNWNSHDANATSYIVYLFVFGLVVPLTVILYSYINIIRTMKKNSFRMGRVNKAESKVTWMIGVMIILFMVAWTPYSIFALMEQFGPGVKPELAVIPALMAKSSICYNPIIYVGMNSQYRAAWSRFWSGSDAYGDTGFKSGLDTTVNKISSKLSIELDMLKRRQPRIQPNNVTIVEEVSVSATNDSNITGEQRQLTECSKAITITNESTANNEDMDDDNDQMLQMDNENKSSITQQRQRQLIVKLCEKEGALSAHV